MPIISTYTDSEPFSEDQTLLTLYTLAGEESGGFVTFRPHFFLRIGKSLIPGGNTPASIEGIGIINVRELTPAELVRAEKEIWVHYHQQKADS